MEPERDHTRAAELSLGHIQVAEPEHQVPQTDLEQAVVEVHRTAVAAVETDTRDSYGLYYTYAYFWCKGSKR